MKIGISIKLDVQKIDKARLFQGAKGTYLDLTTFIDTENMDQYDNHGFISQSQTKEERDGGAERTQILGNCKVFYKDISAPAERSPSGGQPTNNFEDDIPF
jgi:hypothetical protein